MLCLQSVIIIDETLEPGKCYMSAQRHITEDSNVHSELLPFRPEDGGEICVWLPRVTFHGTTMLIPERGSHVPYSFCLPKVRSGQPFRNTSLCRMECRVFLK